MSAFPLTQGPIFIRRLAAANFTELAAADDRLDGGGDFVSARFQFGLNFGQQRLVGKLHRASQGVTQEFAAEPPHERRAAHREKILPPTVATSELRPVPGLAARSDT